MRVRVIQVLSALLVVIGCGQLGQKEKSNDNKDKTTATDDKQATTGSQSAPSPQPSTEPGQSSSPQPLPSQTPTQPSAPTEQSPSPQPTGEQPAGSNQVPNSIVLRIGNGGTFSAYGFAEFVQNVSGANLEQQLNGRASLQQPIDTNCYDGFTGRQCLYSQMGNSTYTYVLTEITNLSFINATYYIFALSNINIGVQR